MNSAPVASLTSPLPNNSSNTSSTSALSPEMNTNNSVSTTYATSETAPLDGLLEKPLDSYTLEELREHVVALQRKRTSAQTWKAEAQKTQATKVTKPAKPPVEKGGMLDSFADLL